MFSFFSLSIPILFSLYLPILFYPNPNRLIPKLAKNGFSESLAENPEILPCEPPPEKSAGSPFSHTRTIPRADRERLSKKVIPRNRRTGTLTSGFLTDSIEAQLPSQHLTTKE